MCLYLWQVALVLLVATGRHWRPHITFAELLFVERWQLLIADHITTTHSAMELAGLQVLDLGQEIGMRVFVWLVHIDLLLLQIIKKLVPLVHAILVDLVRAIGRTLR